MVDARLPWILRKGVASCKNHVSTAAVYYSVDLPAGMEEPKGQRPEDEGRLSILNDVSGAFRPNVLTAFIGETGAGKVRR